MSHAHQYPLFFWQFQKKKKSRRRKIMTKNRNAKIWPCSLTTVSDWSLDKKVSYLLKGMISSGLLQYTIYLAIPDGIQEGHIVGKINLCYACYYEKELVYDKALQFYDLAISTLLWTYYYHDLFISFYFKIEAMFCYPLCTLRDKEVSLLFLIIIY